MQAPTRYFFPSKIGGLHLVGLCTWGGLAFGRKTKKVDGAGLSKLGERAMVGTCKRGCNADHMPTHLSHLESHGCRYIQTYEHKEGVKDKKHNDPNCFVTCKQIAHMRHLVAPLGLKGRSHLTHLACIRGGVAFKRNVRFLAPSQKPGGLIWGGGNSVVGCSMTLVLMSSPLSFLYF